MNFFNQSKIFSFINKYHNLILVFFLAVLSLGLIEALIISPEDYLQGDSVRIMYVHVPSAWISLGIFSSMAFLSILVFIFKNKNLVIITKSLAPSGFVFTLIALVTGSIWGKPTWGTWWAWERIFENKDSVVKITSLITIIGAFNIPIIKFSVDWWSTLHQPSSIKILSDSKIHESMLVPLIIMTAAFALFSLLIFLMKYNTELIKIKNKGLDRL